MEIQKKYLVTEGTWIRYGVNICIKNEDDTYEVSFLNSSKFFNQNSQYLDIKLFYNEDFFKKNNIEYILEKDEKTSLTTVIPTGFIDFTNNWDFTNISIPLCNFDNKHFEKDKQVIDNIEKAIKIKYDAMIYLKRFEVNGNIVKTKLA